MNHTSRTRALAILHEASIKSIPIDEIVALRLENPGTESKINKETQEFLGNIHKSVDDIDKIISEKLVDRELSRLNDPTKQILRMGIFEIQKTEDKEIIVKEYEELAREFLDENSPKLIKGILLNL